MTAKKPYTPYFGPSFDLLAIGGLSILSYFALLFTWGSEVPAALKPNIYNTFVFLFIFVNGPHFLTSYMIFYAGWRRDRSHYYHFTAVGVPLLFLAAAVYVLANESALGIERLELTMQFLVGWHYIKQTYGIVIVTSFRQGVALGDSQRDALKLHLYSIAVLSIAWSSVGTHLLDFISLGEVKGALVTVCYGGWLGSLILLLASLYAHHKEHQQHLPSVAWVSIAALSLWWIPLFVFNDNYYLQAVPLFHSLQYLVLVFYLKQQEYKGAGLSEGRLQLRMLGYYGIAIALGYAAFRLVPYSLEHLVFAENAFISGGRMILMFSLFINIHHYFVDSCIWRKGGDLLKHFSP